METLTPQKNSPGSFVRGEVSGIDLCLKLFLIWDALGSEELPCVLVDVLSNLTYDSYEII